MRLRILLTTLLILIVSAPLMAQDESKPAEKSPMAKRSLPGQGSSQLVINPSDGSVWTWLNQTYNLVAFDGTDGTEILDVPFDVQKRSEHSIETEGLTTPGNPLNIAPTALAFTPDGSVGFIVGEPTSDQTIAAGIVQAFDPKTGGKISELALDGACNAVYALDNTTIYVSTGMQYGYQGQVYKLAWDPSTRSLTVEAKADTGKVPWAIDVFNNNLYVTDLEMQWTAQPDGSMGPPYGAWVWIYEASTLKPMGKIWVGINPTKLVETKSGVLVACSGSKQTEGLHEPSAVLLRSPEAAESDYIYIDSTGVSDVAAPVGANWAIVALAEWKPGAPNSQAAKLHAIFGDTIPEARRWVYTGKVAIVDLDELQKIKDSSKEAPGAEGSEGTAPESNPLPGFAPNAIEVVQNGFFRDIAVSPDGKRMYAVMVQDKDNAETLIMVPIDYLKSPDLKPIVLEPMKENQ